MVCSSCDKPKANLSTKKSRLMSGMTLYLCEECTKAKREPRFVIVLAAQDARRTKNTALFELISDYVKGRRYIGPDILGKEIL